METNIRQVLKEETRAGSNALMVIGIAMALLGILAMLAPLASGVVFDLVFGAVLTAAGIFELVDAFRSESWQRGVLVALTGVVTLAAGALFILQPVVGLVALTVVFIAYLVFAGAFRTAMAFQLPSGVPGKLWTLLSGILDLGLAFVAMSRMPTTSMWLIGTFIGASLISDGIARISLARGVRQAVDLVDPPAQAVSRAHAR